MAFTGTCPVCGTDYGMMDREAGHHAGGSEVFELIKT